MTEQEINDSIGAVDVEKEVTLHVSLMSNGSVRIYGFDAAQEWCDRHKVELSVGMTRKGQPR